MKWAKTITINTFNKCFNEKKMFAKEIKSEQQLLSQCLSVCFNHVLEFCSNVGFNC